MFLADEIDCETPSEDARTQYFSTFFHYFNSVIIYALNLSNFQKFKLSAVAGKRDLVTALKYSSLTEIEPRTFTILAWSSMDWWADGPMVNSTNYETQLPTSGSMVKGDF